MNTNNMSTSSRGLSSPHAFSSVFEDILQTGRVKFGEMLLISSLIRDPHWGKSDPVTAQRASAPCYKNFNFAL